MLSRQVTWTKTRLVPIRDAPHFVFTPTPICSNVRNILYSHNAGNSQRNFSISTTSLKCKSKSKKRREKHRRINCGSITEHNHEYGNHNLKYRKHERLIDKTEAAPSFHEGTLITKIYKEDPIHWLNNKLTSLPTRNNDVDTNDAAVATATATATASDASILSNQIGDFKIDTLLNQLEQMIKVKDSVTKEKHHHSYFKQISTIENNIINELLKDNKFLKTNKSGIADSLAQVVWNRMQQISDMDSYAMVMLDTMIDFEHDKKMDALPLLIFEFIELDENFDEFMLIKDIVGGSFANKQVAIARVDDFIESILETSVFDQWQTDKFVYLACKLKLAASALTFDKNNSFELLDSVEPLPEYYEESEGFDTILDAAITEMNIDLESKDKPQIQNPKDFESQVDEKTLQTHRVVASASEMDAITKNITKKLSIDSLKNPLQKFANSEFLNANGFSTYKQMPDWLHLERHVDEIAFLKKHVGDFNDKDQVLQKAHELMELVTKDANMYPEFNGGSFIKLRSKLMEFANGNTQDCLNILNTVMINQDAFTNFERQMLKKKKDKEKEKKINLVSINEVEEKQINTDKEGMVKVAFSKEKKSLVYRQIPDWLHLDRHTNEIKFLKSQVQSFSDKGEVLNAMETVLDEITEDETVYPKLDVSSFLKLRSKLIEFSSGNSIDCLEILDTVIVSYDAFEQFEKQKYKKLETQSKEQSKAQSKTQSKAQIKANLKKLESVDQSWKKSPLRDYIPELLSLKGLLGVQLFKDSEESTIIRVLDDIVGEHFAQTIGKDEEESTKEAFRMLRLKAKLQNLFETNVKGRAFLDFLITEEVIEEAIMAPTTVSALEGQVNKPVINNNSPRQINEPVTTTTSTTTPDEIARSEHFQMQRNIENEQVPADSPDLAEFSNTIRLQKTQEKFKDQREEQEKEPHSNFVLDVAKLEKYLQKAKAEKDSELRAKEAYDWSVEQLQAQNWKVVDTEVRDGRQYVTIRAEGPNDGGSRKAMTDMLKAMTVIALGLIGISYYIDETRGAEVNEKKANTAGSVETLENADHILAASRPTTKPSLSEEARDANSAPEITDLIDLLPSQTNFKDAEKKVGDLSNSSWWLGLFWKK